MALIVTPSDFKGMITIAQIGSTIDVGSAQVDPVTDNLNMFISDKEPEGLSNLLSYNFYRLFAAGLDEIAPEQRWIDLRDGREYQDQEGKYHKFEGLKPLAARFIYYWYLRQDATQTNGVGESSNNTENANRTSPAQKMVTAWNEMAKMGLKAYHFLSNNVGIYPEWEHPNSWGCSSRYDFLYANYYVYGRRWRWRCNEMLTPINVLSI